MRHASSVCFAVDGCVGFLDIVRYVRIVIDSSVTRESCAKGDLTAIRSVYSLDVDWNVLADISSKHSLFVWQWRSCEARLQTLNRETHGGDLARMAFCVDFDCPGECRVGVVGRLGSFKSVCQRCSKSVVCVCARTFLCA